MRLSFRPKIIRADPGLEKTSWANFFATRSHSINGWMGDVQLLAVMTISSFQRGKQVPGNTIEIGVHEGLFLSGMSAFSPSSAKLVAVDLFESLQSENEDGSGKGSLEAVKRNLLSLSVDLSGFESITSNSLNLSALSLLEHAPYRLFSVDGGHSFETTLNDMVLAAKTVHKYGVIIVDDVVNRHWFGVNDAITWYLHTQVGVSPFLMLGNKLYLCLTEVHGEYLSLVESSGFDCFAGHSSRSSYGAARPTGAIRFCNSNLQALPDNFVERSVSLLPDVI